MSKRKPPRRSQRGRGDSGSGGREGRQQSPPEPDSFKKGLLAGLNTIHKALTAISGLFATPRAVQPADRLRAEMTAATEVERVLAECSGGMMVLLLLLETQAESLPQVKQFQDLNKLWQAILGLTSRFDEFQLTADQSRQLSGAYKLLSTCAEKGQEEPGLQAVQTAIRALEPLEAVRKPLLKIYQEGARQKDRAPQTPSPALGRVCALTGFTILIYTRIGLLHCYIKGG